MDWFYVSDNQQRGPVAEAELDELLRSGTINSSTLVWRSGLAEWQPLASARPAGVSAPPPPIATGTASPMAACAECRQWFLQSDMVRLNQSWVCAGCKPIFLQRLAEGAAPAAIGQVWRSGKQIVMHPETPLPDACVRCNAPASGFRLKRTLYWHSPYFYLLILISILIYAIVAICVRKKAVIHIGLCERHTAERKWFILGSWSAVLLGAALIVAGAMGFGRGAGIFIGIFTILFAAIVGAMKGAVVSAAKIDKDLVWVKGAGKDFLAQFPDWTGH